MKEMIKRIREEKGGFTLAELLIVVAIIAVLVAIAIPVFSGAMNRADESVNNANLHSVKSQASAMYLTAKNQEAVSALATYFSVDDKGNVSTSTSAITPTDKLRVYEVKYPPYNGGSETIEDVQIEVKEVKN